MGRLNGADAATWIVVVFRACLLAPLAEELLFRGALFSWLRGHLSVWPTVLVTALAFAAIHSLAMIMVPLAFVVGIAAGYARERAGSVTPLIIAHLIQTWLLRSPVFDGSCEGSMARQRLRNGRMLQ